VSSKREREYERRRLQKWQQRQAKARAERHRRSVIGWSVLGAIVVVAVIVGVVIATNRPAANPAATPSPTPSASASDNLDLSARVGNGGVLPNKSLAQGRTWTATITTNKGVITAELYGDKAPQAVANFVTLAQQSYFNETKCHRLVTTGIHVLQCGDPTATGEGGPGYTWGPIENAPTDDTYPAGALAMARVGGDGNSMGSQFFFVYASSQIPADSAGGYTVFGQVTSGLNILQAIAAAGTTQVSTDLTAPVSDVIIEKVEVQ